MLANGNEVMRHPKSKRMGKKNKAMKNGANGGHHVNRKNAQHSSNDATSSASALKPRQTKAKTEEKEEAKIKQAK
jgi:hypothetical protein